MRTAEDKKEILNLRQQIFHLQQKQKGLCRCCLEKVIVVKYFHGGKLLKSKLTTFCPKHCNIYKKVLKP